MVRTVITRVYISSIARQVIEILYINLIPGVYICIHTFPFGAFPCTLFWKKGQARCWGLSRQRRGIAGGKGTTLFASNQGDRSFWSTYSDLTRPHPKWCVSKGNLLFQGNLGWWIIMIWPDESLYSRFFDCDVSWFSSKYSSPLYQNERIMWFCVIKLEDSFRSSGITSLTSSFLRKRNTHDACLSCICVYCLHI